MQPNLPFLSAASNANLKPGSTEVEEAVSERPKAFVAALLRDEDCQAYIFASRHASSVISKAKADAWQATCSSLSPKSNPKSVYSLLRSVVGSPSSSSSSPNFPNCSSLRESALVFADYLKSHLSVSQPKPCEADPEATFPSSAEPSTLRSLICPSAFLSPPLNFLRLPLTSPHPRPLAQTKLSIQC